MEIAWSRGLTGKNLDDIRKLEGECRKAEFLEMKLNWDMLETRPHGETNDLLGYENGELAAFLGLYSISGTGREIEATGMVHPRYRRKGVFTKLHELALRECAGRGAERVLLVTERSSVPGMEFIKKTGASYDHSEYRMRCHLASLPDCTGKGVTLRKAVREDFAVMKKLDSTCFGDEVIPNDAQDDTFCGSSLVAELNGLFIGKIGISKEAGAGYIFGFAILPEYRGRGYGREVLLRTLGLIKDDNLGTAILEVAVENENALKLYTTSGFEKTTVYDYFKIAL